MPVSASEWATIPPDTALAHTFLTVSGWGSTGTTNAGPYFNDLREDTSIALRPDADCATYAGYSDSQMICAGRDGHDACFGDSGGPLVLPAASSPSPLVADQLVGIVSFGGDACADPKHPGVYTEIADPGITDYVDHGLTTAVQAPRNTVPPSVQGVAAVGRSLTCSGGVWNGGGAPRTYSYQFVGTGSNGSVPRTASSTQSTYLVRSTDVGNAISCVVRAANADGFAVATSATSPVVQQPKVAPPATSPAPSPVPAPAPKPVSPSDGTAPVARVSSKRCKANRCTINVGVSDAGFSAGIAGVQATVRSTYRTTCLRKHRRVACTRSKTRRLTARALGATRFRLTVSRLPFGRNVFAILATDRAGHVQALPTRVTLTTRHAKKR